jgi:hypothetical protein
LCSQARWPSWSAAANPTQAKLAGEAPVYSVRDPDDVRRQVRLATCSRWPRDMQVGNLDGPNARHAKP